MRCSKCNTELNEDMDYCFICGKEQNIDNKVEKLVLEKEKIDRDQLIVLIREYKAFLEENIFPEQTIIYNKVYENTKELVFYNLYRYICTNYDSSYKTKIFFDNFIDIFDDKYEIMDFKDLCNELTSKNINIKLDDLNHFIDKYIYWYNNFMEKETKFEIDIKLKDAKEYNLNETQKNSKIRIIIPLIIILFCLIYILNSTEDSSLVTISIIIGVISFFFLIYGIYLLINTCPKCNKYGSMQEIHREILNKNIVNETEYEYTNGIKHSRLVTYEIIDYAITMQCSNCGYIKKFEKREKNKI